MIEDILIQKVIPGIKLVWIYTKIVISFSELIYVSLIVIKNKEHIPQQINCKKTINDKKVGLDKLQYDQSCEHWRF